MSFIKSKLQTAINNNMKNTFKTLLFISLLCGFSGAGEMKSVMEGDSVTLQTDDNKILTYKRIWWRFEGVLIAEIPDEGNIKSSETTKRFSGKLKLDHQTGSLTITNTRTIHSGDYKIQINTNTGTTEKTFTLTVYESPPVIDAGRTEVKPVSVTEGESVSLNTDIKPHGDELIVWRFGDILIAKDDKENNKISLYPDERFKDRIHLDQTGSLIITDSRTEHTGEYKLKISSNRDTKHKRFSLYVSDSSSGIDPGTTEVKSVSVTEGDSVTLNTDINPHGDELIVWRFGVNGTLIAKDDKENKISLYPDERFKYRIHLDQTGSLIINNIRTEHTGEYKLKISSSGEMRNKIFILIVNHPPMSAAAKAGITLAVLGAVLLVIAAAAGVGVIYYRRRTSELERQKDKVSMVFVMEGDPVTLITYNVLIKILYVNVYYGETLVAEIRRRKITHIKDEFRERLKLNHQTGSLIISNSRRSDSGIYQLKISICTKEITYKRINVTVKNEGISKMVKKGNRVCLYTSVTPLQKDAEVELKFKNTLIAEKKQKDKKMSLHQDTHDGKLKPNLLVDQLTGSLVIRDITTDQSGDYELKITSSRITVHQIINVFVNDEGISETVQKGNSVDLFSDVTELQEDAEVVWKFKNTVIADKKQKDKTISLRQDDHEIFKQNLLVDKQTGSLVIRDIRMDQSGDYELKITSSRATIHKIFNVTVIDVEYEDSDGVMSVEALYEELENIKAIDEGNESVSLMMK